MSTVHRRSGFVLLLAIVVLATLVVALVVLMSAKSTAIPGWRKSGGDEGVR